MPVFDNYTPYTIFCHYRISISSFSIEFPSTPLFFWSGSDVPSAPALYDLCFFYLRRLGFRHISSVGMRVSPSFFNVSSPYWKADTS